MEIANLSTTFIREFATVHLRGTLTPRELAAAPRELATAPRELATALKETKYLFQIAIQLAFRR